MKWGVKNLIVLFIFAFSMQSVFSYVLTPNELKKVVINKVNSEYKTEIKKYSNDYEISVQGIPQEKITTQENIIPKIELISQGSDFQISSYKRVVVRNSKNQILKAFPVNIQVKVYKNVLVANENIKFNEEINASNTTIVRTDVSKNLNKTVNELKSGYIAKRNFTKGSLILADSIKQKASVLRNSSVDIKFISKTIEIKTQGHALKDGAIGDVILVKLDRNNKTYNAVVESPSEVIIRI